MSKSRSKSSHRSKNQPTLSKRPAWLFPVLLVGVGALLVGLAIWLFQRSQPTPYTSEIAGAPAAQIDQTRFDYGEVRFNTPVETRFRVRNVGDQPLRILGEPQVELVEGCWPPRAVVSSTTINPGEEATVTLQFTMHEGMGGQHEFRVHVLTNDPAAPQQEVVVRSYWVS